MAVALHCDRGHRDHWCGNEAGIAAEFGDDEATALPGEVAFAGARPSGQAITGIDAVTEMVSVLGAQRAFEANASVFDTGKRLIDRTLDVEKV